MKQTPLEGKTPEHKKHRFGCKREKGLNLCSAAFYQKDFVKVTEIHQTPGSPSVYQARQIHIPWLLCELNETYNVEHLAKSTENEGHSMGVHSLSVLLTDVISSRQQMYNLIGKKKFPTRRKGLQKREDFNGSLGQEKNWNTVKVFRESKKLKQLEKVFGEVKGLHESKV